MFLAANSSYFSPRTAPRHLSRRTYLPLTRDFYLSVPLPFSPCLFQRLSLSLSFLFVQPPCVATRARLLRASYVRINRASHQPFSVQLTNSGEFAASFVSRETRRCRRHSLFSSLSQAFSFASCWSCGSCVNNNAIQKLWTRVARIAWIWKEARYHDGNFLSIAVAADCV